MAALGADVKDGQKATLYVRYEQPEFSDDEDESEDGSAEANVDEYALCTLVAGRVDQQQLNLTFVVGDKVTFFTKGDAKLHLSGSHLVDEDEENEDDMEQMYDQDSDEVSGEEMSGEEMSDDGEEMTPETLATFRKALEDMGNGLDEDMHSDDSEEPMSDEIDEEMMKQLIATKRKAEKAEKVESKKPRIVEVVEKVAAPVKAVAEKQLSKKEKKAAAKEAVPVAAPVAVAKPAPTVVAEVKKALPSGLIIEDDIIGKGPMAKRGKKVSVRYIGKLASNGKVFDSNVKGSPFSFKLGAGEVIKGWDLGMHVGGSRKLTIPAAMAYGAKGAKPDIPSNAVLVFDIKLIDIKN